MHATQKQAKSMTNPADTLRDAALYISRHGWATGSFYFDLEGDSGLTPAACMVGAIGMACYGYPCDNPPSNFSHPGYPDFEAAFDVLADYVDDEVQVQPEAFNDAFARDAQHVIDTLEAAAQQWTLTFGDAS